MEPVVIGLDIAKQVFQVHGIDRDGKAVLRKRLRRSELLSIFSRLSPCLIGMEACSTAHYWARELAMLGHEVRLMPPAYVKPYVKRQKNDAADAEAICEAVTRPTMRFVAVKSTEQQGVLALHRTRDLLIRQRTMLSNALRGHLAEFGFIAAQGISGTTKLMMVVEEEAEDLPATARLALIHIVLQIRSLQERVKAVDEEIVAWHKANEVSRRLETIPGIGPIIASALVASITDVKEFRSARQLAASIGLVPRQSSSGNRERLGHITKQGDPYLRRLLVIGASAVLRFSKEDDVGLKAWAVSLRKRRPAMVATVGLANKIARIAWAILNNGTTFSIRPSAI